MMNVTDQSEITQTAQEGIDRFAELIEEYKRMKGVHGDQLRTASYDLYAGILTDSIHYAATLDIDFTLAFGEAYKTFLQERSA